MGTRIDLHNVLVEILGSDNVYFQPPEGFRLSYPCIIYEYDLLESDYASNKSYVTRRKYFVTCIDKDPESRIPYDIIALQSCRHEKRFVSDNLYHDTFVLYY